MQISRLFGIVYALLEHRRLTTAALAARFEVSPRTILRDVDALAAAGVPVYTAQGKGGGVFLMPGYVLDKAVLSGAEQRRILFALQGQAALQAGSAGAGDADLLEKLGNLFQNSESSWIEVDFSRWGGTGEDRGTFETLKTALLQHRVVSFFYASSSGRSGRRQVWPLKLLFRSAAWYLCAFDPEKSAHRTFRVTGGIHSTGAISGQTG